MSASTWAASLRARTCAGQREDKRKESELRFGREGAHGVGCCWSIPYLLAGVCMSHVWRNRERCVDFGVDGGHHGIVLCQFCGRGGAMV